MRLVNAIPGAAAHVTAFIGATAAIGSMWDSPHAICLAAAVTLFGGKFLRDRGAREDRGLAEARASRLASALS